MSWVVKYGGSHYWMGHNRGWSRKQSEARRYPDLVAARAAVKSLPLDVTFVRLTSERTRICEWLRERGLGGAADRIESGEHLCRTT